MLKKISYFLTGVICLISVTIWIIYQKNPLFFSNPEKTWIFLLAGQSNMAGRGYISQQDRERSYHNIFTIDSDLSIIPARQPLHWDRPFAGYSMGLDFAEAVLKKHGDYKILLIPAAIGSSSIREWQAAGPAFIRAAKIMAAAKDYGQVKAILWHQGESNSQSGPDGEIDPEIYSDKLIRSIDLLRGISDHPEVPFIAGSLPDYLGLSDRYPNFLKINRAIQRAIQMVKNASYVDLGDLGDLGDRVHFSTTSLKIMANRYADAFFAYEGK